MITPWDPSAAPSGRVRPGGRLSLSGSVDPIGPNKERARGRGTRASPQTRPKPGQKSRGGDVLASTPAKQNPGLTGSTNTPNTFSLAERILPCLNIPGAPQARSRRCSTSLFRVQASRVCPTAIPQAGVALAALRRTPPGFCCQVSSLRPLTTAWPTTHPQAAKVQR